MNVYNYFIDNKIEKIDEVNNKDKIVVSLDKFKKEKNDVQRNEFKKKLRQYLESIFIEKHHVIFDNILENQYVPDIGDFITNDEIKLLIKQSGESSAYSDEVDQIACYYSCGILREYLMLLCDSERNSVSFHSEFIA